MGKVGQIERVRVSDLIPYEKNARIHDEKQVEMIAKSIEEFGFLNPVLIDGEMNVIAGHGRIMAAKKLEMEFVPAVYVEGLTEQQRKNGTVIVNPLGDWTGGPDVDAGATNRKLGSDMGDAVTGGGLHGKDLSKADVTLNICAHLEARRTGKPVELCCAIGDETVNGIPYHELVEQAREFIRQKGGFEKFAEWGLI